MTEFEYLFSLELQRKLRTRVVGNIFVKIEDTDELKVNITLENEHINYIYTIGNIRDKVLSGYSTGDALQEIIKDYRRYINRKFFKFVHTKTDVKGE